jgi:superfamily II DNA or RNA helicase
MRQTDLGGLTFIMATPHQLDRRKGKPSWDWISENVDVIVVDEAHGAREEWGRITNDLSKSADIFALTATPDALSFDPAFGGDWIWPKTTLDKSKTTLEALVEKKILAGRIDIDWTVEDFAWKHGKGDQLDESGSNIDSPLWYECLRDIVIDEISRSEDTVLVYVDRIEQARTLSALVDFHFSSQGDQRRCGAVWGAMNQRSRRDRVAEFIRKDSDLRGLVNAKLLTQGFDAPKVGSVVIARATDPETALYQQMVGRGLRGEEFGGTPECRVIRVS